MDRLGSVPACLAPPESASRPAQKKTPTLSVAFEQLFGQARGAFASRSVFERAGVLAQAMAISLGRQTITGALTTCGRLEQDWSAAYRTFERERFDADQLFAVPRRAVTHLLADDEPLVVVADDTLAPRRGRKVAEAAWRHDPLGPPFRHQIKWAQQALELSAMLPAPDRAQGARAVPIDLVLRHAPRKGRGPAHGRQPPDDAQDPRDNALPAICARRLAHLRTALDEDGQARRPLVAAFDGGYTNATLFRNIPPRTTLVGRVRKDAKLFAVPQEQDCVRGRPRVYGEQLARPQELLADDAVPWLPVTAWAAGKSRQFQYKTFERCRWEGAGARDLRLIVVKPLSEHPHYAGRRLFFAHPGYLLISDPGLDVQSALQAYLWRWEIEVGFREQKTGLGLGQAQTRTRSSCTWLLQFQAFVYGLLLLAARNAQITAPPRPRWQTAAAPGQRITFGQMQSVMRIELWSRALGLAIKTDFVTTHHPTTKPPNIKNTLHTAVIYAAR